MADSQSEFHSTNHTRPILSLSSSGSNTLLSLSCNMANVWRDSGDRLKLVRSMEGSFTAGRIITSASSPRSPSSREVALLFAGASLYYFCYRRFNVALTHSFHLSCLPTDSTICLFDADCFAMTRQYILPATEGEVTLTDFDVSCDGKFLCASGSNSMLYLNT